MSTFAELAARISGVGVAYLLEGSADKFATVARYLSTHDGKFDGASAYDARIIDIGDLQRGFGVDGTLAASTVAVRLRNTDGAMDFLVTDETQLFAMRWRLRQVLYDEANPSDFAAKQLGVFVNLDNPARDSSSITLNLADDSFGQAAELSIPPTWDEALAVALDPESTQPPVPIAMGGGTIPCISTPYLATDTSINFVLCATTDTAAVDDSEVVSLEISGLSPQSANAALASTTSVSVGRTERIVNSDNTHTDLPIWEIHKTTTLTKDGRDWRVLYMTVFAANLKDWLSARGLIARTTIGNFIGTVPVNVNTEYFNSYILPTLEISAIGPKFSSITFSGNTVVPTIRAPDIAYDLLRHYSRGLDGVTVDQASFEAVSAAGPMLFFSARYYLANFVQAVTAVSAGATTFRLKDPGGLVGRRVQPSIASTAQGLLRRAISDLCQGGLFDVVTDWNGKFTAHVLANTFSLQTSTPNPVDETLISAFNDKVPSAGERWAPYNRVIFASNGRVLDNKTAIDEWGVVLPRTINDVATTLEADSIFLGVDFGIGTFGGSGLLESVVRPIASFDYPLDAMNWELGDFIAITWSRGDSGLVAYSSSVFRIEALTLHPAKCSVTVKAVYIDDLANQLPYLLDDETLLVRGGITIADKAFPDGADGVTFSPLVDLAAADDGDILVLRDPSEAADAFTRNGAWRILTIDSTPGANAVTVATNDEGNYPAAGTLNAGDWYIVRGATTYPTVVSDPTNYPSGGDMYGKQSESGTFSDSSTANVLQAG